MSERQTAIGAALIRAGFPVDRKETFTLRAMASAALARREADAGTCEAN